MTNELAALINRDQAATALRFYTSRLCSILRGDPDRDVHAIGNWTLGDTATHLTSGIENYARWLRGEEAPNSDVHRRYGALKCGDS